MPKRGGVHGMKSFFEPGCIAVAGVSTDPNKLGSIVFANLLANRNKGILKARIYALNPAHERIGDQRAYPSLASLPETPELLIIAVPESQTLGLIESATNQGVNAAIIITSGYAEAGKKDVEARVAGLAARSGMRILGPNTIGVVDTVSGVDSLFLSPTKTLPDGSQIQSLLRPLPGGIVIITQSGHLGQTVAEELASRGIGIRALVGTGNQADVSVEDVLEYFTEDLKTTAIALYIEGVKDGRRFLEVARRASRKRPLVAFKAGKTAGGARAALTHTASLVGDYDAYRAAFRQAGIAEAADLEELVDCTLALSVLPRPAGGRLAIVTNAGGVGAIAADEAQRLGLKTDPLGKAATDRLREAFKGSGFIANASLVNPIDLTASSGTDEFVEVVKKVADLDEYDMMLIIPTHQTPAMAADVARRLVAALGGAEKPVCVCVIGRSDLAAKIRREFAEGAIPVFPTPERAVRAMAAALDYSRWRPVSPPSLRIGRGHATWAQGPMRWQEMVKLLKAYEIVGPRSVVVRSTGDLRTLGGVGFPAACKLLSRDLSHKTEVGGVALGVKNVEDARSWFSRFRSEARDQGLGFDGMLVQEMVQGDVEVILGGTRDPAFGPVVVVGLGGTYAELLREYSLAVAPVTPSQAGEMINRTGLGQILDGYRGRPKINSAPLRGAISRFSKILGENPSVEQIEVNPLIVTKDRVMAIDPRASVRNRAQ